MRNDESVLSLSCPIRDGQIETSYRTTYQRRDSQVFDVIIIMGGMCLDIIQLIYPLSMLRRFLNTTDSGV